MVSNKRQRSKKSSSSFLLVVVTGKDLLLNTCGSDCISVSADASPGNGSAVVPRTLSEEGNEAAITLISSVIKF